MTKHVIYVDARGFVFAGSTRLPMRYIPERGALEFVDKDRRTTAARGSRLVEITLTDLTAALQAVTKGK